MFIGPAEILDQKLKRRFRGLDQAAVKRLLRDVVESYEQVWRERDQARARVEKLEKELAPLREVEHHLSGSLVAAERAAAEVRAQAMRDAEELLEQARAKSKDQSAGAKEQSARIKNEIERLKMAEHEQRERLRAVLVAGMALLEDRESTQPSPIIDPTQPSPVIDEAIPKHKTPDPATA